MADAVGIHSCNHTMLTHGTISTHRGALVLLTLCSLFVCFWRGLCLYFFLRLKYVAHCILNFVVNFVTFLKLGTSITSLVECALFSEVERGGLQKPLHSLTMPKRSLHDPHPTWPRPLDPLTCPPRIVSNGSQRVHLYVF